MPVLLTEPSTSQVHQQPSSLSPVGTPLQVGSFDPLPEAVSTGEKLPDSSDSQVCNIENTEKRAHNYPDVIFVRRASDKGEYFETSQRNTLQITGAGYVSVVRAVLFDSEAGGMTYDIQVLLNIIQTGTIREFSEVHSIITMISQKSSHKFCPGLDYQQYFDHLFICGNGHSIELTQSIVNCYISYLVMLLQKRRIHTVFYVNSVSACNTY